MKKHLFFIALVCTLLIGCKPDPVLPTVETTAVTEVTQTSATTGGVITNNGGADVTSRGVCWSTNQNPTINDMLTSDGSGVGTFTSSIENLLANTTYYVRAYATNSVGTAYGENFCFVTLEENNDDDDNGGDDNGGDDNGGDDNGGDDNGGDDNGGDDNGGDDNGGDDNGGDDNGGDDNGGDDNGGEIVVELPTVTTVVVSEVTINSAMFSAEVLTDGGADVTERGFYWKKASSSSEANFVKVGENLGAYTYQLTGLQEFTVYSVGAYAVNSEGMVKSEIVSFTTLKNEGGDDDDDDETEYVYVDLGLPSGTLWAEHNVGALFPEGYGDHFAWGEIEPKSNYSSDNCSSYQQDLGDISGNPMYDAATANWGDAWRMPTLEEMFELTQQCTWTWTEVNGVAGYKVASKTNDNYIFLPASGFRVNADLLDQNNYGYYWTSTPYDPEGSTPTYTKGCYLDMCSYQFYCDWGLRRNGFTVRPVRNL